LLVAGSSNDGRALLNGLRRNGVHAIITADAFWNSPAGGMTRPFAGQSCHTFATGAATLGRLAQCPVIPCAPYLKNDGTIVLAWGPTIQPASRSDKAADLKNTNVILDFVENAIGQRPSQYVLQIGEERRWNSILQTWECVMETSAKGGNFKGIEQKLPAERYPLVAGKDSMTRTIELINNPNDKAIKA
jgi:lauroyl/myristoyl acyltransferase